MDSQDIALAVAGVIGSGVAVFHGILLQRRVAVPIGTLLLTEKRMTAPIRRLVPPLLHFSTFNWFVGGLALIAAALWFGEEARLVAGVLAGSSYLFGAVANFWGVRGFHPGWVLYTVALGLIVFGLCA